MERGALPQLETESPVSAETTSNESPTSSPLWSTRASRKGQSLPSLPESHRTIPFIAGASRLKKLLAFAGPGYLVAVGYMDPGNWATDIAGGSKFGYSLLSVILLSNLMAMFLQALSAKLGIATGRDLAQACRDNYSRPTAMFLWIVCEIAIAACDLAEVLGSAVALKLLFGLPLLAGVLITGLDVLIVLALQGRGFRLIEAFVVTLIASIAACFAYEIFFAQPLWREAARYTVLDSTVALGFALFINAAILILGAAAFHTRGLHEVAEIADAYKLLSPVLGASFASTLFACALLASGQNSTLTGTLAGQIVMEGFLDIRLKPWVRRLITRAIAIIPAVLVIGIAGEGKVTSLLDR